jgi:hypothetical protein
MGAYYCSSSPTVLMNKGLRKMCISKRKNIFLALAATNLFLYLSCKADGSSHISLRFHCSFFLTLPDQYFAFISLELLQELDLTLLFPPGFNCFLFFLHIPVLSYLCVLLIWSASCFVFSSHVLTVLGMHLDLVCSMSVLSLLVFNS